MYLIIDKVDGHIERSSAEENNESKSLVFDSTDENNEVSKKYTELWDGIENEVEIINGGECNSVEKGECNSVDYGKDFMKIKFNSDDNLPLNKPLKPHLLTIIIKCIFEEDGKYNSQLYLDDCMYELRV